jgi:hypothetical protein
MTAPPSTPPIYGTTLDEEWVRYFAAMYQVGMAPLVVSESRRAFYGGAAVCLVLLLEGDDVAKTGEMVGRLLAETGDFIALQRQGIV